MFLSGESGMRSDFAPTRIIIVRPNGEPVEKPDLTRVAETFVRIGASDQPHNWRHLDILRETVRPLLLDLRAESVVDWYSFLLHGAGNGVPAPSTDRDSFWHIRLGLAPSVEFASLVRRLPAECEMTQLADLAVLENMSFPDAHLLSGGVGEAWRLLGEQSEWLLGVLGSYPLDAPVRELLPGIDQYLHYLANMTQMEVRLR